MSSDEAKVEHMILNNFSTDEMKTLVENIASTKDKEKLRQNILNGGIIEKYKKIFKIDLSENEEEIIKSIYLYLCIEGNAEKIKQKMGSRIEIKKTPYAAGSEKLTFLQWKGHGQGIPSLFKKNEATQDDWIKGEISEEEEQIDEENIENTENPENPGNPGNPENSENRENTTNEKIQRMRITQ